MGSGGSRPVSSVCAASRSLILLLPGRNSSSPIRPWTSRRFLARRNAGHFTTRVSSLVLICLETMSKEPKVGIRTPYTRGRERKGQRVKAEGRDQRLPCAGTVLQVLPRPLPLFPGAGRGNWERFGKELPNPLPPAALQTTAQQSWQKQPRGIQRLPATGISREIRQQPPQAVLHLWEARRYFTGTLGGSSVLSGGGRVSALRGPGPRGLRSPPSRAAGSGC